MAKKIFRLHADGRSEETGWFKSSIITSEHLRTIKTEGKDAATSIPTPFATFDLVKSAFRWVTDNGIVGNTAYHKLVSDALDVAQLFFVAPKFRNKIRIVAWDPKERFNAMIETGSKAQRKLAETLQLFWEQDSVNAYQDETIYNFEKTKRLYFILNSESNRVIGGTSPATLFFAAPDARTAIKGLDIFVGPQKLFDSEYAALSQRDNAFIEYLYVLSRQPRFAFNFPEVYAYLEKVRYDHLGSELRSRITNNEAEQLDNYPACTVLDNSNDICEILGVRLGVEPMDRNAIIQESDFVIEADYNYDDALPLVLPQYPFSKDWTYTHSGIKWAEKTKTPYRNADTPERSRLPLQNDPCYWLTIGNFLEDKIIRLPYPIDHSKFITCGADSYLLPLSPAFFKYFKAEKAKDLLEIKELIGGSVSVELKIPVKGGEISFKKRYSNSENNLVSLDANMALFPFLKVERHPITYRIGLLLDPLGHIKDAGISVINQGAELIIGSPTQRHPGDGGEHSSRYFKVEKTPEAIGINLGNSIGYVVPNLPVSSGTARLEFAIDFGTTNTHIEYKYNNNSAVPFDIRPENKPLLQSLLDRNHKKIDPITIENERIFEEEMIPFAISEQVKINFPLRTALVYNKNTDFNQEVELISQVNNFLLLEKRSIPKHLELNTDLKWSNHAETSEETKVRCYLEYLVTLVFFKTLEMGGDPQLTTITWFYPVSMGENDVEVFFRQWKEVYQKVFRQEAATNLKVLPESIAPYLEYKASIEGLSLSIDIGGGSTDIAVFDEDDAKAKFISSFKFAGNAIFGDGYPSKDLRNNTDRNGFVKSFSDAAKKAVKNQDKNNKAEKLEMILNEILNESKNSADFSSFLFALEKEKDANFSYTRLLEKHKRIKLSFLVFYGAIAYYTANLLKRSGIGIPKYLLLSGTASKSARIIDSSGDLKKLSEFVQFIFEKIYEKEASQAMRIKLSPNPKEVTCKGALKAVYEESIVDSPTKFWIGGKNDSLWGNVLDRKGNARHTPLYNAIDGTAFQEIEESLLQFFAIMDEYIDGINLESKYNIEPDAYEVFKENRSEGIRDLLKRGITSFHKKDNIKIDDTLLFYPLVGILNKLSYALVDEKDHNQ